MSRMFHHILPNVSHVSLVQLSQHTVQFIKAEVILSFLGFGVPVDMVSWGTMLAEAQNELVIGKWWQLFAAGASMAILVTAVSRGEGNLLRCSAEYQPRARGRVGKRQDGFRDGDSGIASGERDRVSREP